MVLYHASTFDVERLGKNIQIQHKQRKNVKDSFRRQLSRLLSLEKERKKRST